MSDTQNWAEKLVGKKIVETRSNDVDKFCTDDLPQGSHRVIPPGAMVTKDFRPERLNVHVDNDGKCTHVDQG